MPINLSQAYTRWLKENEAGAVQRRLYFSFGSLVVALVLLLAVAYGSFDRLRRANELNVRSYESLMAIRGLTSSVFYLKRDARSFAKNPNAKQLPGLQDDQKDYHDDFVNTLEATRDEPEQRARLMQLNALYNQWQEEYFQPLIDQGTGNDPKAEVKSGKVSMEAMRATLKDMKDEEARVLDRRARHAEELRSWTIGLLVTGGLFSILLASTQAVLLARSAGEICRTNQRLEVAHEELRHAHDDLDRRVRERTAELEESREQLRALAAHIESVREEEKARISREIHDQLGQALTGLNMDLSWMKKRLPSEPGEVVDGAPLLAKIVAMKRLVDGTIKLVSQISAELRPSILDDIGLVAAIEWLAGDFSERAGLACEFQCELHDSQVPGGDAVATGMFRILQEALTNVVRHANASQVRIWLGLDSESLLLEVEDDGRGITPAEMSDGHSLGLLGMRERAHLLGAEVRLEGAPGQGTTLRLSVPLPEGSQILAMATA